MFSKFISKYGFVLFYFVTAIILEIVTFVALELGVLPENIFYDLTIILMLSGLIFILPHAVLQYIVTMILVLVQLIIFCVNFSMYKFDGAFFSFDMIALADEAADAITKDYINPGFIVGLVIAFLAILGVGFYICKTKMKYKVPYKNTFVSFIIVLLLVVQGIGFTVKPTVLLVGNSATEQQLVKDTTISKIGSYKLMGSFGYYFNNLMETLANGETSGERAKALKYFRAGEIFNQDDSTTFGIAEDENLIVIMMESVEWFGLSDGHKNSYTFSSELTPNIYNLIQESLIATDFFSGNTTATAETIGIFGNNPVGETMEGVINASNEDQFGFSMAKIMQEKDYVTSYIHSFESEVYSRDKTHYHMGFDNVAFGSDYEPNFINWEHFIKEEDFINYCLEDGFFIPTELDENGNRVYTGEKFYSFYTSMSSHGGWEGREENRDNDAYRQFVINSTWGQNILNDYGVGPMLNSLINYQATIVGLDRAIGVIVEKLKEYGIYDETTIVLYTDHHTYLYSLGNYIKNISTKTLFDSELYTVPLIIKSKNLTKKLDECYSQGTLSSMYCTTDRYSNMKSDNSRPIYSTDRFCSAYDIVPTLLDLFGVEYNKNIYLGDSLFTEIDTKMKVYTNNSLSELTYLDIRAIYGPKTSAFYGNFSMTEDLSTYIYDWPANSRYSEYEKLIKELISEHINEVKYMNLLFSEDIYRKI